MKHTDYIQQAIEESVNYNTIAQTNIIGDKQNLQDAITATWGGEFDMAEEDSDDPTERTYDVWGWTDDTPENEQEWRIQVKLHRSE
jgi:hypothetical protein